MKSNHRRWLIVGMLSLGLPHSAAAQFRGRPPATPPRSIDKGQDRPSHRALDDGTTDPSRVEDILTQRLLQAGENGDLQKELQGLLGNPELLKELTKGRLSEEQLQLLRDNSGKIGELLGDARFRKLLEQAVQGQGLKSGGLSEGQIEALKKLAESKFNAEGLPPIDPADANTLPNSKPPVGPDDPMDNQDLPPTNSLPPNPVLPPAASAADGESWWDRQMKELTRRAMEELNDASNAEAFQDALRSLGGLRRGPDGEQLDLAGLWQGAAKDLNGWLPPVRPRWPEGIGSFFKDLHFTPPNVGNAFKGTFGGMSGGGPASSGPDAGVVVWVIVGIALAIVGWKMRGKLDAAQRGGASPAILGPWPVQPNSVASRDDLRRAFEYLALLRLGAAAVACHHLEIAARLGGDPAHRSAADELAHLYERARYEPDRSPLAECDLASARRGLALLAGVAAA